MSIKPDRRLWIGRVRNIREDLTIEGEPAPNGEALHYGVARCGSFCTTGGDVFEGKSPRKSRGKMSHRREKT